MTALNLKLNYLLTGPSPNKAILGLGIQHISFGETETFSPYYHPSKTEAVLLPAASLYTRADPATTILNDL